MTKTKRMVSFMAAAAAVLLLSGCTKTAATEGNSAGGNAASNGSSGDKIVLTVATSDPTQQNLFDSMGIEKRFQELYPNVTFEFEKFQESGEFENAMKIRASSKSLPDIMFFKPTALSTFGEYLAPLDELEAAKNNLYAAEYKVAGSIRGIPATSSREFVYYWKSIFTECGLEVPTTWGEFVKAAETIKEKRPDLAPIAMGGKDEWPDYPFNEYMPALEAKDGQLWNAMAAEDQPFGKDTPFNKSYQKIFYLFQAGVLGPDPQGIGFDQARAMFSSQQAGMIAAGSWIYGDLSKEAPDKIDDLGAFYLPTRESESDEFVTISQADEFLAVSQSSANREMAENFANFYSSEKWYPEYIQQMSYLPTVKDVTVTLEKPMNEAVLAQKDVKIILYDGGNEDFNNIVTEIKFNYKKLGAEMMTPGFDLEKRLEELNAQWKEAREKLGK